MIYVTQKRSYWLKSTREPGTKYRRWEKTVESDEVQSLSKKKVRPYIGSRIDKSAWENVNFWDPNSILEIGKAIFSGSQQKVIIITVITLWLLEIMINHYDDNDKNHTKIIIII